MQLKLNSSNSSYLLVRQRSLVTQILTQEISFLRLTTESPRVGEYSTNFFIID